MLNAEILDAVYGYLAAQPGLPKLIFRDDVETRSTDYIRPHWLPAKTMSPVVSNGGHIEQRGIFQIDCAAKAAFDAELTVAGYTDAVIAAFPRALQLGKLQIVGQSYVMTIRSSGGYEVASVTFEYVIIDSP